MICKKRGIFTSVLLATVSALAINTVAAQQEPGQTTPGEDRPSGAEQSGRTRGGEARDPGGYEWRGFRVFPTFELSEKYDSNIFATQANAQHDWITILSPGLRINSDWERHALNFWTGADIGFYARNPSENYQDFWVGTSGRYDIDNTANLFGDIQFAREHEERSSPDDVFGRNPTVYYQTDGTLGVLKRWGDWIVRVGGTFTRLDFNDSPTRFASINNDDRDRTMFTAGGRLGWNFQRGWQIFVQGAADIRDYDVRRDDNGLHRDSNGFNAAAGLAFQLAPRIVGEIYGGYLVQDYHDRSLPDAQGLDFGLNVQYRASGRTLLTLFASRSIEETTLAAASAYLSTVFGGRIDYRATQQVTLTGRAFFDRADYQGIARNDDTYNLSFRARYQLTRQFYAAAEYGYRRRNSNAIAQSFSEHTFLATLGIDLAAPEQRELSGAGRNPEAAASRSATPEDLFAGFYGGVQGGVTFDQTNVQGTRGPGSAYSTDFGDIGGQVGPFLGYGVVVNRLYFGAELDGGWTSGGWDHARAPQGRFFSINRRNDIGGSLRVGYVARGNAALLYARVGFVRSEVDTTYIHQGVVTEETDQQTGLRIGVGLEVPVSARTFVRMDYSHTEYPTYAVNYQRGTDTFENSASVLLVGFGFRFNPEGSREHMPPPADFEGLFVGLQVGHGTMGSYLTGARNAGSTLFADFAGSGFTGGGTAGYGFTWNNFYLGAELFAEGSGTRWDHRRGVVGRDYFVRKQYTLGAAGRFGYIVRNAALIYGKVGVAWTGFRTRYTVGTNDVVANDMLVGLRLGGGLEVPVADRWFVRMDYSFTQYPDYSINYGPGIDSFDNSESLLLVSIIRRFET